jgi:hypothetical protein
MCPAMALSQASAVRMSLLMPLVPPSLATSVIYDLAGLEQLQELKNDVATSQHIGECDLFLLPFPYAGAGFHGGSET